MITSLALIFLVGLLFATIFNYLHIPRIVGMLLSGILLGPYVLNLLDSSILGISAELRQIALIIILIKAGISLDISDLKKVGRPAVLLSFLPASLEILAFVLLAPPILHITRLEGAIIGAVLGAVSPAVVVPRMVMLMDKKIGTNKRIPQLIMAGASLDDVVVIVLFYAFVNSALGEHASAADFLSIPVSVVLGIACGLLAGFLLSLLFEKAHQRDRTIRNSTKVILVLGSAFLLMAIEQWLKPYISVSGLLAIISMGCMIRNRCVPSVSTRLAEKFGKLWLAAEILLFVLVGAAVDIRYTLEAGFSAVVLIFLALLFRSFGTWLCVLGTDLNRREKAFCVISYLPKATVQAAIGSVPLAMGLSCGRLVLSIAVLSILLTAPLGALGMDATYKRFLSADAVKDTAS